MQKVIRCFVIAIVLSLSAFYNARASHLSGQDFTYVFVDSSGGLYHYRVSLSIYQDCLNGQPEAILQDNPAYLAVYTGAGALIRTDSVSYSVANSMAITTTAPCPVSSTGVHLCVNKKVFVMDYYLPASPSGYNVSYQRCCLNPTPVNLDDPNELGISCYISIPPSAIATYNNSAIFSNYPPFIIPVNTPFSFDFSATDADGDSLSYALCSAYSGNLTLNVDPDPPAPPPFTVIPYSAPFTYSNPISATPPLAIDPVTGLLTCTPVAIGQYMVTVCCSEWRHGVLINTVQREFEVNVASCTANTATISAAAVTMFPNPATTLLTITAGNKITSVAVSNLLGQTILNNSYNNKEVTIDVSGLPAGIYLVRINGTEVKKFVKQ